MDRFIREESLISKRGIEALKNKTVAVFGLGGVGSYVAEALARAGIGKLVVCDMDVIELSNVNRQLYAMTSTVGRKKTEVCRERLLDINPTMTVEEKPLFFTAETMGEFSFESYDYVVDCIDTVTAKILLAKRAKALNKPIIACMGTGNKLDATAFEVADIYKTTVCPLAKVMRRELKKEGVDSLKVVYSREEPKPGLDGDKRTPSSISFVPPVAGFILAGEVIKDLLKKEGITL